MQTKRAEVVLRDFYTRDDGTVWDRAACERLCAETGIKRGVPVRVSWNGKSFPDGRYPVRVVVEQD